MSPTFAPVMLKKQVSVSIFADYLAAGAVTRIGCKQQLIAYKNFAKNGS
jgi:hypothetical protein